MFEAVFILTAVDAGTRVGRYLLQEMLGKVYAPFADNAWTPGIILTSAMFTSAWGYLVYTGNISTIWPLFGMSNQLLATCALIIGTTMLIRLGKAKYAWVTAGPGLFMMPICMWAGYLNIVDNYLPKKLYLLAMISVLLMVLMAIVFIEAFRRWNSLMKISETVSDGNGDQVLELAQD
jgi:carbon starvation protein